MVMFLTLHPMESIYLNSFVLLEHLAMLLARASVMLLTALAVCRAHRGLSVGFLLYLFTVKSLSLLYLLFISDLFVLGDNVRGLSCKSNIYVS